MGQSQLDAHPPRPSPVPVHPDHKRANLHFLGMVGCDSNWDTFLSLKAALIYQQIVTHLSIYLMN